MSSGRVTVCLLAAVALTFAQRHKPSIDPETKEGYVLQLIQQERDPAQKIKLLNDFVPEFPKSSSLSWILDQLQAVAVEAHDNPKVLELGARMIELDPEDLDAAHNSLQAAEALKDPEQIRKFASLCWQIASTLVKKPDYSKADYAKQLIAYSEYSIASLANNEKDQQKHQELVQALEKMNPSSKWLRASKSEFATLTEQGADKEVVVAEAEKALVTSPDNEDMLMVVADYHMRRGDAPDKVLEYSNRVIEILRTKELPEQTPADQWEAKKERYLGTAYYMVGVVSSIQGRYSQADKNLRAALPSIKASGPQALGTVLYHLGYANYQLAEKGERQRIFDAIKFNEQCATVPSSYRDQALKNVDSIKSEYNLK